MVGVLRELLGEVCIVRIMQRGDNGTIGLSETRPENPMVYHTIVPVRMTILDHFGVSHGILHFWIRHVFLRGHIHYRSL